MKEGNATKKTKFIVVSIFILVLTLALFALLPAPGATSAPSVTLADGSVFTLQEVHYKEGHTYHHRTGPEWKRRLAKIVPDFVERKLLRTTGGTIGFGGLGTNLIMMTVLDLPTQQSSVRLERVRLSDEAGNAFDASLGASTMQMNQVIVKGWEAPAFPRRSKTLTAQFLGRNAAQTWTEIASFPIDNPAYSLGEDWRAEPLPITRTNGEVSVQFTKFVSGEISESEDTANPLSPRLTRMEFDFIEGGEAADHYQVREVAIADSTGNDWRPYLNLLTQTGTSWAKGGEVQFGGALWPGEPAWDIDVEFFRTARFGAESIWEVGAIALPGPGETLALTNEFMIGEASARLVKALAPKGELTDEWQWIVRYWGDESPVYSVAVHTPEGVIGRRLFVVSALDEHGNPVKLVEQRVWTEERQVLFLKVPEGSASLRMTLAFPGLQRAKFRARPEFVERAASP